MPWFQHLKLGYDERLSNSAFNNHLSPYIVEELGDDNYKTLAEFMRKFDDFRQGLPFFHFSA